MRAEDLNIALNPQTTPEKLHELAQIEDFEIRLLVAQHPKTSGKTLKYLSEQPCYICKQTKRAIANHPNATKAALYEVADTEGVETCVRVMHHPNVGIKTLWLLADTLPMDYLARLAEDPKTPPMMLHAMAWKYNGKWALEVIKNPSTASYTLRKLSRYKRKRAIAEAALAAYKARS